MSDARMPIGRRERPSRTSASASWRRRGNCSQNTASGVTTQQVADRADVAIGTLYLYGATKAELLIMVQNQKFAAAIDTGLAAAALTARRGPLEGVIALIRAVVACVREHVENGSTYLHELVFGDPSEPYRHEGLTLSARLEDASPAC